MIVSFVRYAIACVYARGQARVHAHARLTYLRNSILRGRARADFTPRDEQFRLSSNVIRRNAPRGGGDGDGRVGEGGREGKLQKGIPDPR